MDDFDFESAMRPQPPEPQARPAQVVNGGFISEEIMVPPGTDVRPIALSLVPYEQEVKRLMVLAQNIEVDDESGRKEATALALQAKKLRLRVDAIKKSPSVLAAEAYLKDIRHLCATLSEPLKKQVEGVCRNKLDAYQEKLRLEQKRREAAAREEARRLQAKMDEEARQLKEEAQAKAAAAQQELLAREAAGTINEAERAILETTVEEETLAAKTIVAPQVVVHVDPAPNIVRTDEGSSYTRWRWSARLVDESLVERKYLVVDMKKVQKDVDNGQRTIPGFIIEEKPITGLRG